MGYAQDYANLIMQSAQQQGQTLQDVARIRAQAAMTSGQAWAQLPVTLASLGTKMVGDYRDTKLAQQKAEIEARRVGATEAQIAETAKHNRALEQQALDNDTTKSKTELAQMSVGLIKDPDVRRSAGAVLKMASQSVEEYRRLEGTVRAYATHVDNANMGKTNMAADVLPADQATPEYLAGLKRMSDAIFQGFDPQKPILSSPGTEVLDPLNPSNVLHKTPPTPARPDMTPQPMVLPDGTRGFGVYDPTTNRLVPVPGGSPIPPQPSAATIALNMPPPAAIPVTAIRPSPDDGNKPVPGTYFTQNTLYEAAKARVLLNQKPTLQRQTGPMANQSLAAVENTANAIAASVGMSIPELQAEYGAERANLRKRVSDLSANESYALSMRTGLDQALKLSRKVTSYDSPTGNKVENFFKRTLTGDPTLSAYEMWVAGVARDYARITVGGADSVAQLYQGAADKADQLLNPAMNDKQIKAVLEAMVQDVNVILRSKRETVEATKRRIANFLNDEPTDVVPPVVDLSGGQAPVAILTPVGALGLKTNDGRVLTFKTQADRDKAMREGNQAAPAKKVDWIWDPATQSFKKG